MAWWRRNRADQAPQGLVAHPPLRECLTDLEGLSPASVEAYEALRGNSEIGRELHSELSRLLLMEEFQWPAFDEWRAYFAERGEVPGLWCESLIGRMAPVPDEFADENLQRAETARRGWVGQVTRVLAHTIHCEHAWGRNGLETKAKKWGGIKVRSSGDPFCDNLHGRVFPAESLHARYPHFPGCRCSAVPHIDD